MTITAEVRNTGERIRVTLPRPIWEGHEELSPGQWLTALYCGPRTGRLVARFYSYWVNPRTHQVEGEYYSVIDSQDWAHYCNVTGAA